jgi:hypothetical protein
MENSHYFEDTIKNRRLMQRALRELDFEMIAMALVGLHQKHREFVYRNVTRATAELVAEEVQSSESNASEEQVQAAVELLHDILGKVADEMKNFTPKPPTPVDVEVRVSKKRDIIDTLVALAKLAKDQGLLAFDQVDASANPLLAKGLQMVADGWNPAILDSILERTKQTMLREFDERLSMIIEGVESIQLGEHTRAIAAKLEAYHSG